MAKTKARRGTRGRKGRQLIARSGTVTGWEAGLYLHAEGGRENRERKAMLALDVYGNLRIQFRDGVGKEFGGNPNPKWGGSFPPPPPPHLVDGGLKTF